MLGGASLKTICVSNLITGISLKQYETCYYLNNSIFVEYL